MHLSGDGAILYFTKNIYIYIYNLKISCTFSRFHQTLSFYDPKLSADSVVPTSEFRTSAMLLLDYKGKRLPFQGVRTYKGSRTIAPLILPGTRYREPPITQYIGGWVGPRPGVGVFEKEKNPSSLPGVAHRTNKHNCMRVAVHTKFCEKSIKSVKS